MCLATWNSQQRFLFLLSPHPPLRVLALFSINILTLQVRTTGLRPFTLPPPAPDWVTASTAITRNLTFLPPLPLSLLLSIRLSVYLYVKNCVIYLLERQNPTDP